MSFRTTFAVASLAAAALAPSAQAAAVNLGTYTAVPSVINPTPGISGSGPINSLTVSFTFAPVAGDFSFSDDLEIVVTDASNLDTVRIGGFDQPANDVDYSFGGSLAGTFSDTFSATLDPNFFPLGDGGLYTVTVENDYNSDNNATNPGTQWQNITLSGPEVFPVPEPAALAAVAGAAGLAAVRRRRNRA